ncbi:aquaporin AQPAe.a-like [Physella acuta]|uniref:aquaporin AQPAe.a-like n=1 Tax=Physella acuta TaxID=109671 RepID=UPI0027DD8E65|nr:aquaporin AQPAe.a-like [Physella acuta]
MYDIMKENVEDLRTPNLWLALTSEFAGTLIITLLGCGTWSSWQLGGGSVPTALTFGLTVATVVWVFNHISGGHVNPAVSIAALFTRRVSIIRGVLYIIAQVVGGIVGAAILYGLTPVKYHGILGANVLAPEVTSAQGFGVELLVTFVYVLTFFACLDEKRTDLRGSAPLTIGLAVVVCHLFAIPYTRAGLNPARSFGPALIMNTWEGHWVFWVGPIAGALLAGLLYDYIFAAGATFAGAKKCLLRTKKPRKQAEPEKAPLEEAKNDVIEIEETKLDGEKDASTETDVEKGKLAAEEGN